MAWADETAPDVLLTVFDPLRTGDTRTSSLVHGGHDHRLWPDQSGLGQQRHLDVGVPDPLPYLMGQASAELWMTDPTRLYRRFVAWTLDKDAACRVCGKAGHDVLPGLPHRFFPCDGYPIEPIHRPAKR
jgi:hypothetical protein